MKNIKESWTNTGKLDIIKFKLENSLSWRLLRNEKRKIEKAYCLEIGNSSDRLIRNKYLNKLNWGYSK